MSTNYMREVLKIEPKFANTGVKYLHKEAVKYDVGLYFEANGHGTIHFSGACIGKLEKYATGDLDPTQRRATDILRTLPRVVNQAVGDAVTDIFAIEAALKYLGWSLQDWNGIYKDAPTRLTKVKVQDRTIICVTNAERTCVAPEGVQPQIDKLVDEFGSAPHVRSFVRPSGTEDYVRVYSEAKTQGDADKLNVLVQQLVHDMCRGIGDRPT